jgi:hypothetical protein
MTGPKHIPVAVFNFGWLAQSHAPTFAGLSHHTSFERVRFSKERESALNSACRFPPRLRSLARRA